MCDASLKQVPATFFTSEIKKDLDEGNTHSMQDLQELVYCTRNEQRAKGNRLCGSSCGTRVLFGSICVALDKKRNAFTNDFQYAPIQ